MEYNRVKVVCVWLPRDIVVRREREVNDMRGRYRWVVRAKGMKMALFAQKRQALAWAKYL